MKKRITVQQEEQLWATWVLGVHCPEASLNAMFFYNGKNLRGVDKQEQLQFI